MKLAISILLLTLSFNQVSSNINTGLLAHYTFENTLEDLYGNPQAQSSSGVQTFTVDRFGAPQRAIQLENVQDTLEIPTAILNGHKDYTVSLWYKNNENNIVQTLFSWGKSSSQNNLFMFLQGSRLEASSDRFELNKSLYDGKWSQIILTKNSQEGKYSLYLNGKQIQEFYPQQFDNSTLNVEQFYLGNLALDTGLQDEYQLKGALSDLRLYNRSFSSQDAQTLFKEELAGTQNYYCLKELEQLFSSTISQNFSLQYNNIEEIFYQNYIINFNEFGYSYECFESYLLLGSNLIQHEVYNNQIQISFPFQNATQMGCIQASPTQQQCNFQLHIFFSGYLQHTKMFTFIIASPHPNNFTDNATLQILDSHSDYPAGIFTQDDQIRFCTDITCSEYYQPTNIVRNSPIIVEFKTNNPEYINQYPKHKDLTLNGYSVAIDNQSDLDQWNQTGRIIYEFKPPYAGQYILLEVEVTWHQTPSGKRFLQERQLEEINQIQYLQNFQLNNFTIICVAVILITVFMVYKIQLRNKYNSGKPNLRHNIDIQLF